MKFLRWYLFTSLAAYYCDSTAIYCVVGILQLTLISQVMKAMEMEKEEMESEKIDLENQFEALKLMVEPYRYFTDLYFETFRALNWRHRINIW